MSAQATAKRATLVESPSPGGILIQRKCDCGNHTIAGTECHSCRTAKGSRSGYPLLRSASSTGSVVDVPPVVPEVLRAPGRPLDAGTLNFFEPRFGRDFSRVRVHTDHQAAESAAAIGAQAYTAGESVVFSDGRYRPETQDGRRLLAHELAHVVQQQNSFAHFAPANASYMSQPNDSAEIAADRAAGSVMNNRGNSANVASAAIAQPGIHRTVDDPKRFQQTHESLFVATSTTGGKTLLPWEDPDPANKVVGTAETLFQQAKPNIKQHFKNDPGSGRGSTAKTKTTEAALDTDAVDVSHALRARFPFMSVTATDAQIQSSVNVMTPTLTSSQDYLREWLANKLPGWCDVKKYNISETDPRLAALFDRLLADPDIGPDLKVFATRPSGFQRGQGTKREIFVHSGTDPQMRKKVLFHELTHFYAHPIFREWVATTINERWYNEGFTEYLARLAMPPATLKLATSYQDRVADIQKEVAAHVPDDDIARAFFLGEVWRIETRSTISRREVGAQLGLKENATEKEEQAASRSGPGINQTVVPGQHYRFMNLGFDQPTPKPEHVTFFREIKTKDLDPAPAAGVIFEGHASTAGTPQYNLDLSLRRAKAFYEMAKTEGVATSRLVTAAKPPHFGETKLTAEEEDPATRAFNRRVEMQIQSTGKTP